MTKSTFPLLTEAAVTTLCTHEKLYIQKDHALNFFPVTGVLILNVVGHFLELFNVGGKSPSILVGVRLSSNVSIFSSLLA